MPATGHSPRGPSRLSGREAVRAGLAPQSHSMPTRALQPSAPPTSQPSATPTMSAPDGVIHSLKSPKVPSLGCWGPMHHTPSLQWHSR